jgi:hypothetical protein
MDTISRTIPMRGSCKISVAARDREFVKFLWCGAPDATLMQRITACFISVPPAALGLLMAGGAIKSTAYGNKILAGIVGALCLYIGAKIAYNGLTKRNAPR